MPDMLYVCTSTSLVNGPGAMTMSDGLGIPYSSISRVTRIPKYNN